MKIQLINYENKDELKFLSLFLDNVGDSIINFRYFNNRSFISLKNHLITMLLFENESPIGYGHLDVENSKTWLGICIAQNFKGKGYGKIIMSELMLKAKEYNIKNVFLKVDSSNSRAIHLYETFGFNIIDKSPDSFTMNVELE